MINSLAFTYSDESSLRVFFLNFWANHVYRQSSSIKLWLHSLKISGIWITKTCWTTNWRGFMMNSLPNDNIGLSSSNWGSNFEGKPSAKGFCKQAKNLNTFISIGQVCSSMSSLKLNTICLSPIVDAIMNNNGTIWFGVIWNLGVDVEWPCHSSIRHFSCLLPINNVAHSTLHELLRFSRLHLSFQTLLVIEMHPLALPKLNNSCELLHLILIQFWWLSLHYKKQLLLLLNDCI